MWGMERSIGEGVAEKEIVRVICEAWARAVAKYPGLEVRVLNSGMVKVLKVTDYQGVAYLQFGVFAEGMPCRTYDIEIGRGYFDQMRYETGADENQAEALLSMVYRDYQEEKQEKGEIVEIDWLESKEVVVAMLRGLKKEDSGRSLLSRLNFDIGSLAPVIYELGHSGRGFGDFPRKLEVKCVLGDKTMEIAAIDFFTAIEKQLAEYQKVLHPGDKRLTEARGFLAGMVDELGPDQMILCKTFPGTFGRELVEARLV